MFVAGVFCFGWLVCLFFVKAVSVLDSFSLMEILKCFGLGFCCDCFFVSVGVFNVFFWFGFFFPYRSMLPGPEGN